MRIYHYLEEIYGLEAIRERHLKIGRLRDLNDPFEYYHHDIPNIVIRDVIRRRRYKANRDYGIICFSRNFSNPVQWAHYGNSHKGLCLGFDIPDNLLFKIEYVDGKSSYVDFTNALGLNSENFLQYMLSRKYSHWKYEQEYRRILKFEKRRKDYNLIFERFSENMVLKEILIGHRCSLSKKSIIEIIGRSSGIQIERVFPSISTYEMIKTNRNAA